MEIDRKKKLYMIDWKKKEMCICNFPPIINTKGPIVPANEMSYTDFYIRYEYKFLRNAYWKEKLETSKELKSLESYYEVFDKFLTVAILLESVITNRRTFSKTIKEKLSNFIKEHCAGTENYQETA